MNTYQKLTLSQQWRRRAAKIGSIIGVASLAAMTLTPLGSNAPAAALPPTVLSFTSPGYTTWTVPAGVHQLEVEVAGAQGGNDRWYNGAENLGHPGGKGARITGTMSVSPGQSLGIYVAQRGGTGSTGGGSGSASAGGTGYRSGGGGGSGSSSIIVPSFGQGGGGGGGASAITTSSGAQVIAGGGGGAGGAGVCGGNPGGHAGGNGWKESNNCSSNGGDPGYAGVTSSGVGQDGDNASSGSGQGGGGGGGGGVRGGGGADASTDGGGGGGGGTSVCYLSNCNTVADRMGNGAIYLRPVHTPVVSFDEPAYSAYTGNEITISGRVATQSSTGGVPEGDLTLSAVNESGDTQTLTTGPLDAEGKFSYTCAAPCGVNLADVELIRARYVSSNTSYWVNRTGEAPLEFISAATQTALHIDPTQVVTGQEREFTATVNVLQPAQGAVTGDVEFWVSNLDGSDPQLMGTSQLNTSYQASLTADMPAATIKRFWAVYLGTSGFNGSESPKLTLKTDQAETTIVGVTVPDSTVTGESFTLEAEVTVNAPGVGTPTGEVTVTGGTISETVPLEPTGEMLLSIEGQQAGELDFVVTYSGDGNFLSSTTTVTHVVNPADVTLDLSIDKTETMYGESFLLTADASVVSPGEGTITGGVEFGYREGAEFIPLGGVVELDNETALLTVERLDAGDYELQARYVGTSDYLAALSPMVDHTVLSVEPVVTVTPMPTTSTYSLSQLALVEVVGVDDETLFVDGDVQLVQVHDNGEEENLSDLTTLDAAGNAMIDLAGLDPDTYTVYATYSGSHNYVSSTSEETVFTVVQASSDVNLKGYTQAVIDTPHTFTVDVSALGSLALPTEGALQPQLMSQAAPGMDSFKTRVALDVLPTGTIDLEIAGETVAADLKLVESGDGSYTAVATATHEFTELGTFVVTGIYHGDTYVAPGVSSPMQVVVSQSPIGPGGDAGTNGGDAMMPALPRTGFDGYQIILVVSSMLILGGVASLRTRRRASN